MQSRSKNTAKKTAPYSGGNRRPLIKPRSRLVGALRRLADALAKNPRETAARMRNFVGRFPQYSHTPNHEASTPRDSRIGRSAAYARCRRR